MIRDYTAIDLETTGLDPKRDKIIEIGAVRVRGGCIAERFETKVNPSRFLSEETVRITGIRDEDLADAPDIGMVIPQLTAFVGEDILVGHRILFDYSFLKRAAVNHNLTFEKEGIDTLKLARKFLPDLESRRLSFLCRYFQIPHQAHRAMQDAEAAAVLYERLGELFYMEADFTPKILYYKVKKEKIASKTQKERLYNLIEKHKLIIDYSLDNLTRNEASRITDKILSTYGR